MGITVRDLLTRFGADTTGFVKGAAEIKAELTELNSKFFENQKAMRDNNKEIAETEKKMKELDKQIKASKTANAELNQKYEEAKNKLTELNVKKAQLKTTEQDLKAKIGQQTTELKKNTLEADKNRLSFSQCNEVLKKTAAGYLAVVTAMFTFSAKMAGLSDEINTLSKITGLSTEELQKYQYAAERIDVPLETLAKSMSKLTKNMNDAKGGTGEALDTFKELGVSYTDAAGNLRDKQTVFEEVIATLAKIENETQRDAYAMDLFGKSATDLNPLILGGADALKQYSEEAERLGLILSQEQLDKLNSFNDKIDTFKAKLQQYSMLAGVEMVDAFDSLFDKSDEIMDLFVDLANVLSSVIGFTIDHKEGILALVAAYGSFKATLSISALIQSVTTALKGQAVATTTAKTAQTSLNASMLANPIVAIISAVAALTAGMVAYALATDKATGAVADFNKTMHEAEKTAEDNIIQSETEIELLQRKAGRYEELRQKTDLTAEESAELKLVLEDLQNVLPNTTVYIDEQTGAYRSLNAEIETTIQSMRNMANYNANYSLATTALAQKAELEREIDELFPNRDRSLSASDIVSQWGKMDRWERLRLIDSVEYGEERPLVNIELTKANNAINVFEDRMEALQKATEEADYYLRKAETYRVENETNSSSTSSSGKKRDAFDLLSLPLEERLESVKNILAEKRHQLELDEISEAEYYTELEMLLEVYAKKSESEWNSYYETLHKYKKQSNEELQKLEEERLDEAAKAFENMLKAQIQAIEDEKQAEKELLDAKLEAIDKEIEARKRLKEDRDMQKEIDAVKAQLKYSQLDGFSRMELEKKLAALESEKEELEWQRQKSDEKERYQDAYDNTVVSLQQKQEELQNAIAYTNAILSGTSFGTVTASSGTVNNSTVTNNNSINMLASATSVEQLLYVLRNYFGAEV